MSMNSQGRVTRSETEAAFSDAPATFTGNRALMLEEPLIFESGSPDRFGVDLPKPRMQSPGWAVLSAAIRSGSMVCPNPKPCAITHGSAARITASIWGFSRSDRAR